MKKSRFPKSRFLVAVVVVLAIAVVGLVQPVASAFGKGPNGQDRVEICHIPPGNPAAAHTITVGAPAVQAHLAHGDTLGACPTGY